MIGYVLIQGPLFKKHMVGNVFKNYVNTNPKQMIGRAFVLTFQRTQM